MDKSLLTNLVALLIVIAGISITGEYKTLVLNTGLFALSGGLTNWLAIHMLFEKVPGFYGSGVIPARFEEFKSGIKILVMEQFFSQENLESFFSKISAPDSGDTGKTALDKIVGSVDFDGAFATAECEKYGVQFSMVKRVSPKRISELQRQGLGLRPFGIGDPGIYANKGPFQGAETRYVSFLQKYRPTPSLP